MSTVNVGDNYVNISAAIPAMTPLHVQREFLGHIRDAVTSLKAAFRIEGTILLTESPGDHGNVVYTFEAGERPAG